MAKKIYMSADDINDIVSEIKMQLGTTKCYGEISVRHSFKNDKRRATLSFTPSAWAKMTALVARFSTEVQWHGLVERLSASEFMIYDILVPPHEVTAATVTSNQKEYNDWLNGLDDEPFSHLRFHGHSHVEMSVSPSSTDNTYRTDVVTQLPNPIGGEDVFYIFLIINKRHEWSAEIYDLSNNALYSTGDIDVDVMIDGGNSLEEFIQEAKKLATHRPTVSYVYDASRKVYSQPNNTSKQNAAKKESQKYGGCSSWAEYYGYDPEDVADPFYAREY